MPGSIRLGRLRGIEISFHITFLPILLWTAWQGTVLYGGLNGAVFGVLAVVLLFGCVLLHELAHGFHANACGIEVSSIVLLPIGGLTTLDSGALKPRDEIRIALVGPLANLALALILGGTVFALARQHDMDVGTFTMGELRRPAVSGMIAYLALANLMIFLFNLLPAFPLDGGRALRAILSTRMPYAEATHRAAIGGRAFGAGLAAMGVTMLLLPGLALYGVTLIIVAVMIYLGATYEDRTVRQYAALNNWTVGQVLQAMIQTVGPHEPLSVTFDAVVKGRTVPVVIGDPARLVGLVTAKELRHNGGTLDGLSVAHVMRTRFPTVRPSDPLWVAYEKLRRSQMFAIPVVHRQVLYGLVSLSEIRRALHNPAPPKDEG